MSYSTWHMAMPSSKHTQSELLNETPSLDDEGHLADDIYQMPFKMKYRDKWVLQEKAKAANQSPTKWLLSRIYDSGLVAPTGKGKTAAALQWASQQIEGAIAFTLDRRRQHLAEQTAKQLGFHKTEDLAKDLLYQAIQDPEMAEEFLFGKLRQRLRQDAQDDSKTPPRPSSKAA